MSMLDPRLHAIRPDLADAALVGQVTAARFVAGSAGRVNAARAALRRAPSPDATMLTEALFGEPIDVFDTTPDGWSWVQLGGDRFVGFMQASVIGEPDPSPTHKVSALSTFAFASPDIKSRPLMILPLGARVTSTGETEDRNARYALISPAGAVVTQHLAPLEDRERDWVGVAERLVGSPYLWGGKTVAGIDCSGLVQVALGAAGISAPRDSDMQEASLGELLPGEGRRELRRGDLVFWKGHVGIMHDGENLLHANAHHMAVTIEPLAAAVERARGRGQDVTSMRRLPAIAAD